MLPFFISFLYSPLCQIYKQVGAPSPHKTHAPIYQKGVPFFRRNWTCDKLLNFAWEADEHLKTTVLPSPFSKIEAWILYASPSLMAAAGIYWVLVLFELTSCNFTKALGRGEELHFEEYLFFF